MIKIVINKKMRKNKKIIKIKRNKKDNKNSSTKIKRKNKKINNINKNKIWNKLPKMLYYILMVHYSSHTLFYEGGAKNPLKGTSVKFLVFARNASFV